MDRISRKRPASFFASSQRQPSKRLRAPASEDQAGSYTEPEPRPEKWFDTLNESARDACHVDDDPPFYLKKPISSDRNSICAMASDTSSPSARDRTGHDDNNEDFRSVIDDLTIQNKKLKKRLKVYEDLHCSHLQDEKLFEVRIHGLAVHRRKELEELLRAFVFSIEGDLANPELEVLIPGQGQASEASVPLKPLKKPSSRTPNHKLRNDSAISSMSGESQSQSQSFTNSNPPVDSTYASMTGHTKGTQGFAANRLAAPDCFEAQPKQRYVKSFLHEIPESLLPKSSMAMSDRAKTKLVVKRLEQIFTGRRATRQRHKQSYQQQAVSHSAAEAERGEFEDGEGRVLQEGSRQAHIFAYDAHLKMDTIEAAKCHDQEIKDEDWSKTNCKDVEQRPTRPLDLDLHRAQVLTDNMEYVRHLGKAPARFEDPVVVDDQSGWIYLNLLTSMAQLHTLNISMAFVRKAILDMSSRLRLSEDGAKIRWLGGHDGTELSSESGDSEDGSNPKSSETNRSISKRGSLAGALSWERIEDQQELNSTLLARIPEASFESEAETKRRPIMFEESSASNDLKYRPLVFQPKASEQDDDSNPNSDSGSADSVESITRGYPTSNTFQKQQGKPCWQKRENGLIIFYNRAKFCTDLCGDPYGASTDKPKYRTLTDQPVECDAGPGDAALKAEVEEDFTLQSMDMDMGSITSARSATDLEEFQGSIADCVSDSKSPLPFEASGLGGVQPDDNFVVNVRVQHAKSTLDLRRKGSPSSPLAQTFRRNPHSEIRCSMPALRGLKDIPRSQGPTQVPETKIISAVKTNMSPSSLPSPSYLYLPFSSPSTSEYDVNVPEVQHPASPSNTMTPNHPHQDLIENQSSKEMLQSLRDDEGDVSWCDSESDGSSIDLLAHARVLDPDAIAAQEREFNFNSMEQLADLFANSSAATAGGGSGQGIPCALVGKRMPNDVDSIRVDEHESGDSESDMDDSD